MGATGTVGCRVVQNLLHKNVHGSPTNKKGTINVVALVRNATKARLMFADYDYDNADANLDSKRKSRRPILTILETYFRNTLSIRTSLLASGAIVDNKDRVDVDVDIDIDIDIDVIDKEEEEKDDNEDNNNNNKSILCLFLLCGNGKEQESVELNAVNAVNSIVAAAAKTSPTSSISGFCVC